MPTKRSKSSVSPDELWYEQGFSVAIRGEADKHPELASQTTFNPAIEKQATVFFFNHFVLASRGKETTRGFLELAVPLFQASQEGTSLYLAVEAVSVSVVANWPGRKHLQQRSTRLYGQALQAAQTALRDPQQATSNETLLSILMFSLYESVTSSDQSVQAWTRHIDGAVAIVRARGTTQFNDQQSLALFRAVRTQMLTNAIQQRKALPDFPGINGWMGDTDGEQTAVSILIEKSIKLPGLLAKSKPLLSSEKTAQTTAEITMMLQEAYEVQQALSKWELQIPPQWGYRSISNHIANQSTIVDFEQIEELEVWPGPTMHVYKDVHIACIRNNNRVSQILCSSVVIDALKWLTPDPAQYMLDERYTTARIRLQSLVDDICYSVPFHLYGPDVIENARPIGRIRNGKSRSKLVANLD